MRRILIFAWLLACSVFSQCPIWADTFYLSPTGADIAGNDGRSLGAAWATLPYAASRVSAGTAVTPNTIQIAAGTYQQTNKAILQSWVNVQGAGIGSTTINANWTNNSAEFSSPTSGAKLMVFSGVGNNQISGLTLGGNNRSASGALWMENATNITAANLVFTNFGSCAIVLASNCSFITVSNATLAECGYESTNYSLGAIQLYQVRNSLFTAINLRSTLAGTGYGFKAASSLAGQSSSFAYVSSTIFDRINSNLKPTQAYQNQGFPNFSLEFFMVGQTNNELRNCYLVNTVSQSAPDTTVNGTNLTMRIHDNTFDLPTSAYAIECKTHRLEIDHNYFSGGYGVLSDFTAGTANMISLKIHHNVAEKVGQWFFNYQGAPTNLTLLNNTVYFFDGNNSFTNHYFLSDGNTSISTPGGFDIRNNLVVAPSNYPGAFFRAATPGVRVPVNVICSNNLYQNVSFDLPTGSLAGKNTNTVPGLNLIGWRPDWYYLPASLQSPVVNAGAPNGSPYFGSAPDIGAYELTPKYLLSPEAISSSGPLANSVAVVTNAGVAQITNCDEGDWVRFDNIDFSSGLNSFRAYYANGGAQTNSIELRLDATNGPVVSQISLLPTGSGTSFIERKSGITITNGAHNVYVLFRGGTGIGNFAWFELDREPTFLEAESFNSQNPVQSVTVNLNASGGFLGGYIGGTDSGDWVAFTNVDLSSQPGWIGFRYGTTQPTGGGYKVTVRLDSTSGPILATYFVTNTGSYSTYTIDGTNIDITKLPTGTIADPFNRTVYFIFGGGFGVGNFDWFELDRTAPQTTLPTTLLLTSSQPTNSYGTTVTFTATIQTNGATVASATSNVVFTIDGVAVATNALSAGVASFSSAVLSVGSHSVSAQYAGSSLYAGSAALITQSTVKAATSVVANAPSSPSGFKSPVTFTASLPAAASGSVIFSSLNGPFSTNLMSAGFCTSLSISNLNRGTNLITAAYAGDGNFLGSTNSVNQVVTNHPPVAGNAAYLRARGSALAIPIANLLSNVTDVDGDPIALLSLGASSTGATITTNTTTIFYQPSGGITGNSNDVFTYTASDGMGGSATANVLVNVDYMWASQVGFSNGSMSITFNGTPNQSYLVQTATNLVSTWWAISTNTAGVDGTWLFVDTNANFPQQFYRVMRP